MDYHSDTDSSSDLEDTYRTDVEDTDNEGQEMSSMRGQRRRPRQQGRARRPGRRSSRNPSGRRRSSRNPSRSRGRRRQTPFTATAEQMENGEYRFIIDTAEETQQSVLNELIPFLVLLLIAGVVSFYIVTGINNPSAGVKPVRTSTTTTTSRASVIQENHNITNSTQNVTSADSAYHSRC